MASFSLFFFAVQFTVVLTFFLLAFHLTVFFLHCCLSNRFTITKSTVLWLSSKHVTLVSLKFTKLYLNITEKSGLKKWKPYSADTYRFFRNSQLNSVSYLWTPIAALYKRFAKIVTCVPLRYKTILWLRKYLFLWGNCRINCSTVK